MYRSLRRKINYGGVADCPTLITNYCADTIFATWATQVMAEDQYVVLHVLKGPHHMQYMAVGPYTHDKCKFFAQTSRDRDAIDIQCVSMEHDD
jgi:hypothetical protein